MVHRHLAAWGFPEQAQDAVLNQVSVCPGLVVLLHGRFGVKPSKMKQSGQVGKKPGVRIVFVPGQANTEDPAETIQ